MSNSAQEIGYVTSALDMTKDKSAQQLVDNYAVAGDSNIEERVTKLNGYESFRR